MTIHQNLAQALHTIINGSKINGRWLDASGTECSEGDEGAEWHAYTEEEQHSWLESCAAIASKALSCMRAPTSISPTGRLPALRGSGSERAGRS